MIISILLVPKKEMLRDGGTVIYSAILYKIVKWNELDILEEDGTTTERRHDTEVCIFPTNYYNCKT